MRTIIVVADAGLLNRSAGAVGLEAFEVDLWVAHSSLEAMAASYRAAPVVLAEHRGRTVSTALEFSREETPQLSKEQVLFLTRRVTFVRPFTSGRGTTCGEWTPPIGPRGQRGFFKVSAATGVCPVRCQFCYLQAVPFQFQSLALNLGDFARQIEGWRRQFPLRCTPVVNLGESGGLVEWCAEFSAPEIVQAYVDAALSADVTPYLLTKRALWGLELSGVHVGVSVNPARLMGQYSPGASSPEELLDFLLRAKIQGASTVIRWGPIFPGHEEEYRALARMVHQRGLGGGRITVDLLRFSRGHPATPDTFEYRAHKWQENIEIQRAHLAFVADLFPDAHRTGCKLDPAVAIHWVREGLIQAMPCACWV